MSNELVPLSYARDAYNVLHGTELKTHTDALTAEQAARINSSYNIEVHVGTHGQPPGEQPNDAHALLSLPTQQEYAEAAAVVAGMQPGDTLFLEGYGFDSQPSEPIVIPDLLSATAGKEPASPIQSITTGLALMVARELRSDALRSLEQSRRDYEIGAWDYAQQLATLKGIRIVYADHDAFERESLQALSQGKDLAELMRSSSGQDQALVERMHIRRERQARNVLKDWALENLPPEEASSAENRKPKLVLLFGGMHKEGLERAFHDIGLDANVTVMESTNAKLRAGEQMWRVIPSLVGVVAANSSITKVPKNNAAGRFAARLKDRKSAQTPLQRGGLGSGMGRPKGFGLGSLRKQGDAPN